MDKSVFIDTAYIISIAVNNDKHHKTAVSISKEIVAGKINLVITELVLIEAANFLSKIKFRNDAVLAIKDVRKIALVEKIDPYLLADAWNLFDSRSDKEWGMTDCYSFVVMEKYGIKEALTTDKHFEQAGFKILLK